VKYYGTYSYPNIAETLNIFDVIITIAPIEITINNIEYRNPPEYEPVVIFPKNNPATHDCIRIAMPNNSNLDLESNSIANFLASSDSSWASKLVKESITSNVVKLVIAINMNPTITYGCSISLFVFSIVFIFSATLANVSNVCTFPPPAEIISNNTLKLIKI